MATYSNILAWRISRPEEPGESMGSQRFGHNIAMNTTTIYICIHVHIRDSLGLKFSCSFFSSFCFFRKYRMILLNHFLFIWILVNHAFYIENGFVFLLYLDEPKLCFWKRALNLTYIKGLFDILGGKYTWNYKLPSWKIFRIVLKLPQILLKL